MEQEQLRRRQQLRQLWRQFLKLDRQKNKQQQKLEKMKK